MRPVADRHCWRGRVLLTFTAALVLSAGCGREESLGADGDAYAVEAGAPASAPCCSDSAVAETSDSSDAAELFATPLLAVEQRASCPLPGETGARDTEGAPFTLPDPQGRVTVLGFFYSQCSNRRKCGVTLAIMRELQVALARTPQVERTRLALMSYDPAHDDADVLVAAAAQHGLALSEHFQLVTPGGDGIGAWQRALGLELTVSSGLVAVHGTQFFLIDAEGRVVREYHTVHPSAEQLLDDLEQVLTSTPEKRL